jgi:hypothetical protein
MKKQKSPVVVADTNEGTDIFSKWWSHFIMIGLIIIIISALFFQVGYLKYAPKAHDIEQWRWGAEQTIEYNKSHKDKALWTDSIFAGMPTYMVNFTPKFLFVKNIVTKIFSFIHWRVSFLIFAAIGMYVLLIYLRFHPLIALFSAFSFALCSHFIGLSDIGHSIKLQSICYIPWIFLLFEDLRQHKRLLSVGLLSIFLIDQLRINHFQIVYYTYLLLFMYWVAYLIKSIKDKEVSGYIQFTLLAIFAFVITILAVANPYLTSYEYSHFTIRGGSTGLSNDYATSWSFGIQEVLSFIVPNIFGGISPNYWGPMPFTQTSHYMGIIVLFLAILASVYYFKDTKIKTLVIISFIILLISFGKELTFMYLGLMVFILALILAAYYYKTSRNKAIIILAVGLIFFLISIGNHTPLLSNLLLKYLPLFNKFRVPAMILCIVQFCVPVLAAYGIMLFIEKSGQNDKKFNKVVMICLLVSIALCLYFLVMGESFGKVLRFTNDNEIAQLTNQLKSDSRYTTNQINQMLTNHLDKLKAKRLELFVQSGMQSFALLSFALLLLWSMLKGFLRKNVVLVLLVALTIIDLSLVNYKNYLKSSDLVKGKTTTELSKTQADNFLIEEAQNDLFRIFPIGRNGEEFRTNRWAYYHQTIGGYHGAKLGRYQEMIDRNLFSPLKVGEHINWNVVNMLNVKYLVLDSRYSFLNNDIEFVLFDRDAQYTVYRNNGYLPRAWFVKNQEVFRDKNGVMQKINDPDFNPRDTVLLEKEVKSFDYYDDFSITMLERDIHHTTWKTSNDTDAFMVISEIYYPEGWNIYINGEKTDIYLANTILRGIRVPAGDNNLIEMKFEPKSYEISLFLSTIGLSLSILLTIFGLILYYRSNYGQGIVYKIHS